MEEDIEIAVPPNLPVPEVVVEGSMDEPFKNESHRSNEDEDPMEGLDASEIPNHYDIKPDNVCKDPVCKEPKHAGDSVEQGVQDMSFKQSTSLLGKPKSKIDLNTEITSEENEPNNLISDVNNSSKTALNFKPNHEPVNPTAGGLESSAIYRELFCAGTSSKSDLNVPQQQQQKQQLGCSNDETSESSNSTEQRTDAVSVIDTPVTSNQQSLGVIHQSKLLVRQPVDGRNALNYGPRTALEAMLSDLLKLSEKKEEEDTTSEDGPPAQGLPDTSSGIRHRRKRDKPPEKKTGKQRKKKKDLDTVDVSDDAPGEIPLAYCCPVCLDVFYNAYNVRPCGHTFCEPCLRRLAKYSQDARKPTSCPVCRNLIDTCTKNKDLTSMVEFYLPEDFRRRRRMESSNKFMRHPLPSAVPVTLSPKRQLSRIVSRLERNRLARRRPRVGSTPIRFNIWRLISFVMAFMLLKGMLLVAVLCVGYVIYDHGVHVKLMDMSISGAFGFSRYITFMVPKFWGFSGIMLFGGLLVVFLRFTRPKGIMWYKPIAGLSDIHRHEF